MYVLRSEVCCDFAGFVCNVLGSFSGPYEGHFGRCVGPSGSFAAKRAICIIWCNLRCFSVVLRTDVCLRLLLSERLCSTGRRCFSDRCFVWILAPSGVDFGAFCGQVERSFFMCFLASFF